MIMESTSRDKIERSVVIQEPILSIPAIGRSLIVATQEGLRSGSAQQGVRSAESVSFASAETERDRALVSERHREIVRRTNPFAPRTDG